MDGGSSRGPLDQQVETAKPPEVQPDYLDFIEEAIMKGDRLQDLKQPSKPTQAKRRALIIAAKYNAHCIPGLPPLPATLQDAVHIYKMLVKHEYNEANIRILVDGSEDNAVLPNRDNIIQSLDWLVSNTRKDDYRYLHFSGHGTSVESKQEEGKQTVELPKDMENPVNGDNELDPKSGGDTQYTQTELLDVCEEKIKYYNEAIITSFKDIPSRRLKEFGSNAEYNMIRDKELNRYFAMLPEGSKLTCTLDCCHSGRLLECNFKLKGPGFRGSCFRFDEEGNTKGLSKNRSQLNDLGELESQDVQDSFVLDLGLAMERNMSLEDQNPILSQEPSVPFEISISARGRQSISVATSDVPTPQDRSLPLRHSPYTPLIRLTEALPEKEMQRDKIKADVLAWSACHQRQRAVDYSDTEGGIFTRAFTQVIAEIKKNEKGQDLKLTVTQVYDKLNEKIKDVAQREQGGKFLQYAQVWTSLGEGDATQARAKLKQGFTI